MAAGDLTTRFPSLATFRQAAEWDLDALAVIRVFERYRTIVAEVFERERKALEQAAAERQKGPILRRVLEPRTAEKAHQDRILQPEQALTSIEEAKERLFDRLDRAPSSRAEKRAMVLELNLILAEIARQPMAIPEAMMRVPTGAVATGEPSAEPGRWDRMRIHYEMEVGRRPRRGAMARHSPQVELEHRLERVSRFAGEDPPMAAGRPALRPLRGPPIARVPVPSVRDGCAHARPLMRCQKSMRRLLRRPLSSRQG